MTNETEVKEFDFKRCPFCGGVLDFKKDLTQQYSLRSHIFKCHACGTTYEVTPVIVGYEARKEGIKPCLGRGKCLDFDPERLTLSFL